MVETGTNRLQPSLEGEEFRDRPQGTDSWVRANSRSDVMPALVGDSGQPAVTRDEARHVGRDAEAGQHNSGNSGSDRGRRRGGGQYDRVEGARGQGDDGGSGAWDTRGTAAERPRCDRGRAGARHAQDDLVHQGDSLRDCQAHDKHSVDRCDVSGIGSSQLSNRVSIQRGKSFSVRSDEQRLWAGQCRKQRAEYDNGHQKGWLSRWTAYDPGFLIQAEGWGHAVSR